MATETTCPICGFELTSTGKERCPQCGADLTCFNVLDSIPDEPAQAALRRMGPVRGKSPLGIQMILGACFLFSVGLFGGFILAAIYRPAQTHVSISYQKPLPVRIKMPERRISGRSAEAGHVGQHGGALPQAATTLGTNGSQASPEDTIGPVASVMGARATAAAEPLTALTENDQIGRMAEEGLDRQVVQAEDAEEGESGNRTKRQKAAQAPLPKVRQTPETLPADIPAASEQQFDPNDFTTYEAAPDDTLWRISKTVYGSGIYYPVLMETNPGIRVHEIEKGMRLRVYKDPAMAKRLHRENARVHGHRAFYRYLVREDDTFGSIALKFYGDTAMKDRIMDLNPNASLRAGIRIEIELD